MTENTEFDIEEYKRQSETQRQTINNEVYDEILKSAKFFLQKRKNNIVSEEIVTALERMEEASRIPNLNEITDIYLFESEFGLNSRELSEEFLYIILIMIAQHYKDEQMHYLEEIILTDGKFRGSNALQFYLKIGTSHKEKREYVLNFIESNIDKFPESHKNMVAMFIKGFLQGDRHAKTIFDKLNITNPEVHFRNPPTQTQRKPKPAKVYPKWWEFWK
ncbi:hypothetical protein [Chryseobacterium geocarposphaerae]|uniref:Uncharacterized protein n=1 Tax=Chryseobacterium geocarposphaerae TaxID=1416776 RepID=A0A2M9C1Z0_9FLAO|nr:hypothetical protein [Chryseobacterium geocarposphaerae]PJJ64388.1 hypothetical protein CLV73_2747 [Chryseobacterium geocarposphaerae]